LSIVLSTVTLLAEIINNTHKYNLLVGICIQSREPYDNYTGESRYLEVH